MITVTQKGDWSKTTLFLERAKNVFNQSIFDACGRRGVKALSAATPKDTGNTASMWRYEIEFTRNGAVLNFLNDNINEGCVIAIILQYGHGTRGGGYVEGRDYINPALQPLFDDMAEELWKEVRNA